MRRPIDYARLEALEQRDRDVKTEIRLRAQLWATCPVERYEWPARFRWEEFKALRQTPIVRRSW